MSVLREAAHSRHRMVSAACWWWCPPVHAVSQAVHVRIVDGFYDALEGPSAPPPFLLDDELTEDRNLMTIALILLLALSIKGPTS